MLRSARLVVAFAASGIVLAGCAQFDDSAADGEWRAAPELTPEQGPQPELPEAPGGAAEPGGGGQRGDGRPSDIPPPDGCTDHDPAVLGTCLDTVQAVAALPPINGKPAALAAERDTGKVMRVVQDEEPSSFAKLPVDAGGGGGLTGIALSPSYTEDGLVFAYVTTADDNRVVRFAKDEKPQAILTGIPRGRSGNRGALAVDPSGALLVATGDAGKADAASDKKSLAGKVLRIDTSGKSAQGNPDAGSRILADGLHDPGGVCASMDGSRIWVTDRAKDADAVHLVEPGESLNTPVWTWKDKPGVAGCADSANGVSVAMSTDGGLHGLEVDAEGSVSGKPRVTLDGKDGYGRLGGLDALSAELAITGTVNKDGGKPVSSDDRVVLIAIDPTGGEGSKD